MKKILLLVSVYFFIISCASSTYQDVDYKISDNYKQLRYKFALKEIKKKIFGNKNKWPTLYASFSNTNYYYGEKLRITKVFNSATDNKSFGSTLAYLETGPEAEQSFSVVGENGYSSIFQMNFKVDFICGDKNCSLEGIKGSSARELFNKFKKKITKVNVSIISDNKTVFLLLTDPLKDYRSGRLLPFLAARRHVWRGMPKDLFQSYGVTKERGTFICGANNTCNTGYTEIQFNDGKVFSLKKDLENRHTFRSY